MIQLSWHFTWAAIIHIGDPVTNLWTAHSYFCEPTNCPLNLWTRSWNCPTSCLIPPWVCCYPMPNSIVQVASLPTITSVTFPSMSVNEMCQLTNTLTWLVAALESPRSTPGIPHHPSTSPTPHPVYHCNTRHTHPAPPHTAGIMRFRAKPHKCCQPCTFQGNAHASHYWWWLPECLWLSLYSTMQTCVDTTYKVIMNHRLEVYQIHSNN